MNKNYQTVSVHDYIRLLDGKRESLKARAERHLLKQRKADNNAKLLEKLLA